jgi:hypothetical protein
MKKILRDLCDLLGACFVVFWLAYFGALGVIMAAKAMGVTVAIAYESEK